MIAERRRMNLARAGLLIVAAATVSCAAGVAALTYLWPHFPPLDWEAASPSLILGGVGAGAALLAACALTESVHGRAHRTPATILAAAGMLVLVCSDARADEPTGVAAGRLIAQRNCGGCHAVAAGPSPFAEAPAFGGLYRRYGTGGLDQLLARGMLADHPRPLDEGRRAPNPRMPSVALDSDEIANLAAYLRSLEPGPDGRL
jgi:mono/diheme cytochrome c family protein